MNVFESSVNINGLVVDLPDVDQSKWKGLQQDNFIPDREAMLREGLEKDFPGLITIETFDEMMSLITRSKALSNWYLNWKTAYVESLIVPRYFERYVDKDKYKNSMEKLKVVNNRLVNKSNELNKAALLYKEQIKNIEQKYSDIETIKKQDKLLFISTLTSEYLPINILQMIEKYTPSEGGPTPSQYGREALINYKVSLVKMLSTSPDIDVVDFVNKSLLKY